MELNEKEVLDKANEEYSRLCVADDRWGEQTIRSLQVRAILHALVLAINEAHKKETKKGRTK